MHPQERNTPYIPRYRTELQFAKRISIARWSGHYGLLALWGGIALDVFGVAVGGDAIIVNTNSQLQLAGLGALLVGVLAIGTGVCLLITSFTLHVISSLQAVKIKRAFPQNPLPGKFLHAELIRWLHRIDLVLTVAATIAVTLATLGIGAAVTIPSGIGLGFLGWIIATIWGLGANRLVYKEVARQRKLTKLLPTDARLVRSR
jgi:hypothetical protein